MSEPPNLTITRETTPETHAIDTVIFDVHSLPVLPDVSEKIPPEFVARPQIKYNAWISSKKQRRSHTIPVIPGVFDCAEGTRVWKALLPFTKFNYGLNLPIPLQNRHFLHELIIYIRSNEKYSNGTQMLCGRSNKENIETLRVYVISNIAANRIQLRFRGYFRKKNAAASKIQKWHRAYQKRLLFKLLGPALSEKNGRQKCQEQICLFTLAPLDEIEDVRLFSYQTACDAGVLRMYAFDVGALFDCLRFAITPFNPLLLKPLDPPSLRRLECVYYLINRFYPRVVEDCGYVSYGDGLKKIEELRNNNIHHRVAAICSRISTYGMLFSESRFDLTRLEFREVYSLLVEHLTNVNRDVLLDVVSGLNPTGEWACAHCKGLFGNGRYKEATISLIENMLFGGSKMRENLETMCMIVVTCMEQLFNPNLNF